LIIQPPAKISQTSKYIHQDSKPLAVRTQISTFFRRYSLFPLSFFPFYALMMSIAASSRSVASSRRPAASLIGFSTTLHVWGQQLGLECHLAQFTTNAARTNPVRRIHFPSSDKRRLQSSSVLSSLPASVSPTTTSPVNPPASTRPATLDLPQKNANVPGGRFSYYISLGRAYLAFYKTGLINVFHNYRASIPFRKSLGLSIFIPTSPPSSTDLSNPGKYLRLLSRSDFQLLRRSSYDVRRIIPFTIILIICGEMTPLVALALGYRVTPLTCRLPRQMDKERLKRLERKQRALEGVPSSLSSLTAMDLLHAKSLPKDIARAVKEASAEDVLRACAVFGLSRTHSLSLPLPGPLTSMLVNQMYRPRLKRWFGYLALDDRLIVKGGGLKGMSAEEVQIAVEERGGVDVGVGLGDAEAEQEQRKWLETWVERTPSVVIGQREL
jgi:hypothetical protein